jgi:hypothetical protein
MFFGPTGNLRWRIARSSALFQLVILSLFLVNSLCLGLFILGAVCVFLRLMQFLLLFGGQLGGNLCAWRLPATHGTPLFLLRMAELLPFFLKKEYIVDWQSVVVLLIVLVDILKMLYLVLVRRCSCFCSMFRSLSFSGGARQDEMMWCSWLALQDGATEVLPGVYLGGETIFMEILWCSFCEVKAISP